MNNKEFDRSVCFQFYASYLEQAELVYEQLGPEMCAEYFIALVKYGLYQEESDNPMIKMLISGLKNTIDAGQLKRERAFNGENKELTEKIIKYKEETPDATQREIADACKCSIGKVNKSLNSNSNNNINNNSNTNSNNNSVNMNVNKEEVRSIQDLTEKEAAEIIKKIKRKEKYIDIQKEYNLEYGSVTKDFEKQFRELQKSICNEEFNNDQDKYEELATYWGGTAWDVRNKHKNTILSKFVLDDIILFLRDNPIYRPESWRENYGNDYRFDVDGNKVMKYPYPNYLSDGLDNYLKNN